MLGQQDIRIRQGVDDAATPWFETLAPEADIHGSEDTAQIFVQALQTACILSLVGIIKLRMGYEPWIVAREARRHL